MDYFVISIMLCQINDLDIIIKVTYFESQSHFKSSTVSLEYAKNRDCCVLVKTLKVASKNVESLLKL